jgi:DNA polymerase-3 subunit delta'
MFFESFKCGRISQKWRKQSSKKSGENNMIAGHQDLIRDFKNLVKNNHLAHSYIFFGEPEVGKFYFAKHLANFLENNTFELPERPLTDTLILENSSTGSGQIGIDLMRELKRFLWQKPVISSRRLAVINNADYLTPEAQNSILKIAEEPPASAVLILITNHLENLMPTLLSRFQKIYFGRLSDQEIGNFLQTTELSAWSGNGASHRNDAIISGAWGRPGRAVRLISDSLMKEAEKYAVQFLKTSSSNRSQLIKNLVNDQKEKPELLDRFFEILILYLRRDAKRNADMLKSVLHRLFLIKSYNTNKRLQIEAIFC